METKEERSFMDKVIIKWYEDPEVLQMVKKRVSTATAMMEIDSMKDVTAGQKKVKWFENPEILQILKTMFDPWLNEDGMPDATSFFSRCPRGFEEKLVRLYYRDDPDIRHMTDKRWGPQLDEDGKPEGPSLRRIYPKCFEKDLLEAWPTLKSTLEEYGILCIIDLVFCNLVFRTTKKTDPDIIPKARDLVDLLSKSIPIPLAMKVLGEIQYEMIRIGHISGGLCIKFGITRDQYVERRKLLMGPSGLEEDYIIALGPLRWLKLVKKIAGDCILHKVRPTCIINTMKRDARVMQSFKHLHL
ncbi:hypothetical protein TB2_025561 [Malus domestica]